MSDELPPLDDDVQALLRRAGQPRPPPGFDARLWSRLAATAAATAASAAAGATVGAAASTSTTLSGVKAGLVGLGLFALGSGAGVVVGRTVLAPPPPAPEVRVVTKEVRVEVPVEVRVEVPVPPRPTPPRNELDQALARERAMVEMGRTALARGENALAITHFAAHQRQFPRGQLAEEREALWVRALVADGKVPEARERAAVFFRTFPQSLLAPSVRELVR